MFRLFRKRPEARDIYFHEDDYCQQQILPASEKSSVSDELANISEFSREYDEPNGVGWTDVYVREETGAGFDTLRITHTEFDEAILEFLPRFDNVYTGYGSYRQKCKLTGAWGTSQLCCIFADWNEDGMVQNVWTNFFDDSEDSIAHAARAVSALASHSPMVYIDWAWDYTADPSKEGDFTRLLKEKLKGITSAVKSQKE